MHIMARTPTSTTPGQAKQKRPRQLGPRTLWLILKPGTDPQTVRDAIDKVTFNGRTVLSQMGSGAAPPAVKFTVDIERRGGVHVGGGDEQGAESTDDLDAAA